MFQATGIDAPPLYLGGFQLGIKVVPGFPLGRADGGWAQTKELDSDAYATGTALFVLHQAGMGARNAVYKKGVKYLLETQAEDGTWRVAKRAVPIQNHFETGFPYGKDQFISAVATAWADMALLHTLPDAAD